MFARLHRWDRSRFCCLGGRSRLEGWALGYKVTPATPLHIGRYRPQFHPVFLVSALREHNIGTRCEASTKIFPIEPSRGPQRLCRASSQKAIIIDWVTRRTPYASTRNPRPIVVKQTFAVPIPAAAACPPRQAGDGSPSTRLPRRRHERRYPPHQLEPSCP
jgi:hypothetical protein